MCIYLELMLKCMLLINAQIVGWLFRFFNISTFAEYFKNLSYTLNFL